MSITKVDKSKRYDRQLRLWGDHGQECLEFGHVCLINANATGTEILKNLILPGVGNFTIIDSHKLLGEDVGNNFFLDESAIGKNRGKIAVESLEELNEEVKGHAIEESVDDILDNNAVLFERFTVVVACSLQERTLLRLADFLWTHSIPLVTCRSVGFIGCMRIALKEHSVIESHPDSAIDDLRLDIPFDGLSKFCDQIDLNKLDKKDHSHTPWLVLIYKALQHWKATHDGKAPANYKQKNEFKQILRDGIRKNSEGVPEDEENFDEAIRNVNTALVPTRVPDQIKRLFEEESCLNLTKESTNFWILLAALKMFVENEGNGQLPVRGSLPDMTSDSARYVALQRVYREQAASDVNCVSRHADALLQSLEQKSEYTREIGEQDIKTFCRNSAFLSVTRCRALAEEYDPKQANIEVLASSIEDPDDNETVWYLMLRAADRFSAQLHRAPGQGVEPESDIPVFKNYVTKLLQELGLTSTMRDDVVQEMCRYGGSELHTIAAYMGGVAAQEIIKLLTKQFVPICNTYIYNAMTQTSRTLQL